MLCASCGKPLTTTNKRARYCDSTCRANGAKRRAKGVPELRPEPTPTSATTGGVHAATLEELTAAAREGTALGRAALALAARIDAGEDTGSALAAAVKQLQVTLAEAVKGAQIAATPMDELRARRDAKRGA